MILVDALFLIFPSQVVCRCRLFGIYLSRRFLNQIADIVNQNPWRDFCARFRVGLLDDAALRPNQPPPSGVGLFFFVAIIPLGAGLPPSPFRYMFYVELCVLTSLILQNSIIVVLLFCSPNPTGSSGRRCNGMGRIGGVAVAFRQPRKEYSQ